MFTGLLPPYTFFHYSPTENGEIICDYFSIYNSYEGWSTPDPEEVNCPRCCKLLSIIDGFERNLRVKSLLVEKELDDFVDWWDDAMCLPLQECNSDR